MSRLVCTALIVAFAFGASASSHAAGAAGANADAISGPSERPGRDWAIDPTATGENVPSEGRSLFDFLVVRGHRESKGYDVPFPFGALVKKLEAQLQSTAHGAPGHKAVLIPLGRSLQRAAAAPEFFAFPRVVLAVDGEPSARPGQAGMLLKDRLYLGYQEKENLIEVISYNEAAGRFEFQLVTDYRAGGTPQVRYANRAVCMACHQNAAPIFSRQVWDETNANPRIATLLRNQRRTFYGIDLGRGVDVPNAIDDASERANLYSAYQLLWQTGCSSAARPESTVRCRANLFRAALQYRLSGRQQFDDRARGYRDDVLPIFAATARERWPAGLRIPNPDIPNRNPFMTRPGLMNSAPPEVGAATEFSESVDVQAVFDALAPRPPLDTWPIAEPATVARLVGGLSDFMAAADIHRLDTHLYGAAARRNAQRSRYTGACETTRSVRSTGMYRLDFACSPSSANDRGVRVQGRLYGRGDTVTSGRIERLSFVGADGAHESLTDIDVTGGTIVGSDARRSVALRLARAGGRVRRGDGNAVESMRLEWKHPSKAADVRSMSSAADASVSVIDDFAPVDVAIEQMVQAARAGHLDAFADKPFRRASLMPALFERLGMKALAWCCLDDRRMPPPVMEPESADSAAARAEPRPESLQPFFRYCATCHQSSQRSPPNFLRGSASEVSANLAHCAERLYVRLAMWRLAPEQRSKTPMPPDYALYGLHASPRTWPDSSELAALRGYVERALHAEGGRRGRPESLLQRGYEDLRSCLP